MALAERAGIGSGMSGIDLCCCNGAGMRFLVRFRNVAKMHGIDATEKVVEQGRARCQAEGLVVLVAFSGPIPPMNPRGSRSSRPKSSPGSVTYPSWSIRSSRALRSWPSCLVASVSFPSIQSSTSSYWILPPFARASRTAWYSS
jgi:hypothetical protein